MVRRLHHSAALLILGMLCACAADPTGTIRETYQSTRTGENRSNTVTELLEVGLQDNLGPDLQYRASERVIRSDVSIESNGERRDEMRFFHQPSLDLILTAGALRWTQGFETQITRTVPSDDATNELHRSDILEKFEWMPVELPAFTFWVDSRSNRDDMFVDLDDIERVLQIEDSRGPFNYLYTLEAEQITDNRTDTTRDSIEHRLRGSYRDEFFDQKLSISSSVYVQNRRTTNTSPRGSSDVIPPGEVVPTQGLSGRDQTPEIVMLTDTPALIDADDGTSAGINIGGFASGGETSWNIGVALPPESTVNLVFLSTASEVDSFFLTEFSFAVYASDDNNFWTLVSGSTAFTYEQSFRRFRILIPDVKARYVKVVNTASPPASPAVFVTEMRVFGPAPGAEQGDRTVRLQNSTENLTGNIAYRIHETLTLGYDIFAQRARNEDAGTRTRDERRLDNSLTALWTPVPLADVSLRATDQRSHDPLRLDEEFTFFNGLVDLRPLETLDLAINYSDSRRRVDRSRSLDTRALQARVAAQLLDTLQSDLSVEQNTQEDFLNERTIRRTIMAASLFAQLTHEWSATVELRNEAAGVVGAGAEGIPDPAEQGYSILLLYKPSDQFTSEVFLEWRDTFAGSGLDQRYRFDWIPFPDGAFDIQFDARREVADAAGTTVDSYLILSRWAFNPRAFLEINYSRQDPNNQDLTEAVTASLNISL